MECEVSLLKRQAEACRERSRSLKEVARSRKDKTRQLLVACAYKLEEKEATIQQLRRDHDDTLALIARELAFLQANMLKERKRLETMVAEKNKALETLALENERLRKHTKKQSSSAIKLNKMSSAEDRDMDTPSSEDSSPKSSFSSKMSSTKVETKPPPPAKLAGATPPSKRPPPPPPPLATGPKPPVPSRAGVDKLLSRSPNGPTSPSAPQPPVRTTSLTTISVDRADSGRESDLTSDVDHPSFKRQLFLCNQDEGFFSSHEDGHASGQRSSARMIRNHREVLKPSDLKFRGKAKATSTSNLAVLEEHQVTGCGGSQVTTVTYWTEPYL